MQFNCEVAAKVLQLNLAAEIQDSYDTVHLHKQIAITLDLYSQLDYVIFFKVDTDIDQRIFERLPNLKKILLKNCTITKERFLDELNFNRTFRIIRDNNQNIRDNNFNTLSSHDYLVYGWNNLTNDKIINNHKNLSSILH
ncbi:24102_t:CDS:2, partial [Gigaspora margarita]